MLINNGFELFCHPSGDKRLGIAIGMDAIILHPFRFEINLLHEKRQQRNIKLFGEARINSTERFGIASPVVGWQADLHQQRLGVGRLDLGNDAGEIPLYVLRGETTQPVIAAQLDQHPARLVLLQQCRQTRQPLRCRVAADTGVHHPDLGRGRSGLPVCIQQRRPGLIRRHTIAGAQAVAQYQQRIRREGAQTEQAPK